MHLPGWRRSCETHDRPAFLGCAVRRGSLKTLRCAWCAVSHVHIYELVGLPVYLVLLHSPHLSRQRAMSISITMSSVASLVMGRAGRGRDWLCRYEYPVRILFFIITIFYYFWRYTTTYTTHKAAWFQTFFTLIGLQSNIRIKTTSLCISLD